MVDAIIFTAGSLTPLAVDAPRTTLTLSAWIGVAADIAMGLSCVSIAIALWTLLRKREAIEIKWAFAAIFANVVFIAGLNFVDAWNIWQPIPGVFMAFKLAALPIALIAAVAIWFMIPYVLEYTVQRRARPLADRLHTERAQRQLAEEELRRVEAVYRVMPNQVLERLRLQFELMPIPCILKDQDSLVTYVNPAAERVFGYTLEEMAQRHPRETIFFEADWPLVDGLLARLRQGEVIAGIEARNRAKDGRTLTLEWHKTPLFDDNRRFIGIMSMARDVTAFRQSEKSLRESEERLHLALESSGQALFDWDIASNLVYLSGRWNEMLGGKPEPLRMPFGALAAMAHPDDLERLRCAMLAALKNDQPYRVEHRVRNLAGDWIWIQSHGKVASRDSAGRATRLVGYNSDITPRKFAEFALAGSEERYRATFDNAPIGIMHTAIQGYRILRANRKVCQMLGYSPGELLHMTSTDVVHPDQRFKDSTKYFDRLVTGEIDSFASERIWVRKDGTLLWVRRTVSLVRDATGAPDYLIRIVEDISDRKRAEEAAARERILLRTVVDALPARIYAKDLQGRFVLQNRANAEAHGVQIPDQILGKTVFDVFPESVAESIHAEDAAIIASGIPVIERERTAVNLNGDEVIVVASKMPLLDETGKIIGIVGINRDVTERRKMEAGRAQLAAIVENSDDAIVSRGMDGGILTWNAAAERMFGYPAAEAIGKNIRILMPPDQLDAYLERRGLVERGSTVPSYDTIRLHRDGHRVNVSATASAIHGTDGKPVAVSLVFRDISARVLSAQRLAVEHAVTRILAESASESESVSLIMQRICEELDWGCGLYWTKDMDAETLRCREGWHGTDALLGGFVQSSRRMDLEARRIPSLHRNAGPVRRVWNTGETVWIRELRDAVDFHRAEAATAARLCSAFAFPILAEEQPVGIMEFYSSEARVPDEDMLRVVRSIGRQIGQFMQRKRAELALRESEERFRAIVEQAAVGIACVALTGELTEVNQKFCDMLGYSRDELLGKSLAGSTHPDDYGQGPRYRQQLQQGQIRPVSGEKRYIRKDGSLMWARRTLSAVCDGAGKPLYLIIIIEDITERKRVERALLESEELFHQLANNIPQVFWISDVGRRKTIYVSPACERMLGMTATQLKSDRRRLIRAVHPDDRKRIVEARKASADGSYDEMYRIIRPDGSIRWVHDRAFPVHDADGRVFRIAGIAEDVTDRQQVEEELTRERTLLRQIIDAVPDHLYVKDPQCRYLLVNAAGLRARGVTTADQIVGKTAFAFYPREVAEVFDAEDDIVMRTGVPLSNREQTVLDVNGRTRWHVTNKVALHDLAGRTIGLVAIGRDITELRQSADTIRQLNLELEQRVRERTAQLETVNKELESFAYSVSHDLRAPLRSIDGFSQALIEEYGERFDSTGQDYLFRVRKASQRMGTLIDDLLLLSRITRSDILRSRIDLSELAREIATDLQKSQSARRANFRISPGIVLDGDARLVRVALENLMQNAWKFTGRHTTTTEIEVGETESCGVKSYYIRDNGVGFDMAYADKLFGAFQRLHSESEFPGSGIGLATVHRVVRLHGGEIWAQAKPDAGATFYFTLTPAAQGGTGKAA